MKWRYCMAIIIIHLASCYWTLPQVDHAWSGSKWKKSVNISTLTISKVQWVWYLISTHRRVLNKPVWYANPTKICSRLNIITWLKFLLHACYILCTCTSYHPSIDQTMYAWKMFLVGLSLCKCIYIEAWALNDWTYTCYWVLQWVICMFCRFTNYIYFFPLLFTAEFNMRDYTTCRPTMVNLYSNIKGVSITIIVHALQPRYTDNYGYMCICIHLWQLQILQLRFLYIHTYTSVACIEQFMHMHLLFWFFFSRKLCFFEGHAWVTYIALIISNIHTL